MLVDRESERGMCVYVYEREVCVYVYMYIMRNSTQVDRQDRKRETQSQMISRVCMCVCPDAFGQRHS